MPPPPLEDDPQQIDTYPTLALTKGGGSGATASGGYKSLNFRTVKFAVLPFDLSLLARIIVPVICSWFAGLHARKGLF
jgi:hypothetical protein